MQEEFGYDEAYVPLPSDDLVKGVFLGGLVSNIGLFSPRKLEIPILTIILVFKGVGDKPPTNRSCA